MKLTFSFGKNENTLKNIKIILKKCLHPGERSDNIAFAVKREANTREILSLTAWKILKKCLTIKTAWCIISELRLKRASQSSSSDAGGTPARQGSEIPKQSNIWQLNRNATLNIFLRFSSAQIWLSHRRVLVHRRGIRQRCIGRNARYEQNQPLAAADCAAGRHFANSTDEQTNIIQNEPNQANYGAE